MYQYSRTFQQSIVELFNRVFDEWYCFTLLSVGSQWQSQWGLAGTNKMLRASSHQKVGTDPDGKPFAGFKHFIVTIEYPGPGL